MANDAGVVVDSRSNAEGTVVDLFDGSMPVRPFAQVGVGSPVVQFENRYRPRNGE
ncbi:hypothetical protein ACFQ15_05300 [Sphingomonas hankookensis]|uniref:hypothetical protein n=1 Tax=Sphingomonas hankookensis TaxID=563996 RepID=UPI001F57DC51|nr:hypothetical protein [Sphingomonas hankookensis]